MTVQVEGEVSGVLAGIAEVKRRVHNLDSCLLCALKARDGCACIQQVCPVEVVAEACQKAGGQESVAQISRDPCAKR